ncbi:hypothetical protein HD806DRAFT_490648 [Xylariaceae sp. AK1471]|nr:hypothetical protein HD806DRAFT_490648 [Xylariaceae sp. AK1471]
MNQTDHQVRKLVEGWVSGPGTRGSIDIIWSSFLTIFLCTWTTLCLNVPHPKDGDLKILLRKGKWMLFGIIVPELVLSISLGQYASARRSVQQFRELGYPQWTLRHSFFTDMGGLVLQPKGGTPFIVSSTQLAFLVEKQIIEYPTITTEEIWDKSKADLLSKSIAFLQASWLVFQLLGRAILHLPTTALQISAGAIVLCNLGNFVSWLHKPNDVRKGITLGIDVSLEQILSRSDDAATIFCQHTALGYIDDEPLKHRGLARTGFQNGRFSNDTYPDLNAIQKLVFFCLGKGYAACHLAAWNSQFPTRIEHVGWQIASSVVMGATIVLWVFEVLVFNPDPKTWNKFLNPIQHRELSSQNALRNTKDKEATQVQASTNSSRKWKRQMNAHFHPAWRVFIRATLVPLYVVARAFIIVEALISLRAQPAGVYRTLDIAGFLS